MKAIQTNYNGYKFRSRLEARYAVFFDELGIKWDYETEGYVLNNGLYYLPDFYLKAFDCFAEVKPDRTLTDEELQKLVAFGEEKTIILLDGRPSNKPYKVYSPFDYADYFVQFRNGELWATYQHSIETALFNEQAITTANTYQFEYLKPC